MLQRRKARFFAFLSNTALLFGAVLSFGLPAYASECALDRADESVELQRVIDGDTVKLKDGRNLRFTAINTPELARRGRPAEPYAEQAKQVLQQLLKNTKKLHLRFGKQRRDRYQRLLAHVFLDDGTNVQESLIREGLAFHILEPPNLWHLQCYRRVEQQAENAGIGVWTEHRYQAHAAKNLRQDMVGFYRVRGRVDEIWSNRRAVWLGLSDNMALRIDRRDLKYFKAIPPESLKSHRVIAKGWMFPYKDGLNLRIKHPAALRILD